jgi:flavoprotein
MAMLALVRIVKMSIVESGNGQIKIGLHPLDGNNTKIDTVLYSEKRNECAKSNTP